MAQVPANIHEVPFVRMVIPLTAGILTQYYLNPIHANLAIVVILILLLLLVYAGIFIKSWEKRWIYGLILNLLLALFGSLLVTINRPEITLKSNSNYSMLVRLTEPPVTGNNSIKVKAEIIDIKPYAILESPKPVLLYFLLSDSASQGLNYGDILALSGKLREFSDPPNPYQFNMKRYMYLLGIVYYIRVNQGCWEKVGNKPNKIFKLAYKAQNYVIETLKAYGIKGQELAVISALMLGYKSLLDDEIQKVYSSVGAMHILAVSGLHVGLVFGMVVIIITLLPKRLYWLAIRLGIAFAILWGYALITGLSPSVSRATIMFSLFAIGQTAGLKTNSYNTLAAAAFMLLISNPFMLFNVGFQLSFAAVLSIVFFHPIIYSLLNPQSRLIDYVWSLLSVSAAAQILTLPLTLYYFGQFPVVFLITNLIAVPLATIVLYLSLVAIAFSIIGQLGFLFAKILGFVTWLLNSGLKLIDTIPFSSIGSIYFTSWQAILLFLSILMLSVYLVNRYRPFLQCSFISLIGVLAISALHLVSVKNHAELIVFPVPKSSVICINSNGNALLVLYDSIDAKFSTDGYIRNRALQKTHEINLNFYQEQKYSTPLKIIKKSGLALLIAGNKTIALAYNDSARFLKSTKPLNVDLLVANRFYRNSLLNIITPQKVIIDPSIKSAYANRLSSTLIKSNIAFYNTSLSGFFEYNLNETNPKTVAFQ
ncbi:MAG TPA: ComEC family competence protein [Bacteroidales bacterium]|nr:ComEC family competence protein [Bacteroidales bacterium]